MSHTLCVKSQVRDAISWESKRGWVGNGGKWGKKVVQLLILIWKEEIGSTCYFKMFFWLWLALLPTALVNIAASSEHPCAWSDPHWFFFWGLQPFTWHIFFFCSLTSWVVVINQPELSPWLLPILLLVPAGELGWGAFRPVSSPALLFWFVS